MGSFLHPLFWLAPIVSLLALIFAYYFFKSMMKEDEGTDTMKKIALYVRKGAMAYLKQQYKVVAIVFLVIAIIFSIMAYVFQIQNPFLFLPLYFYLHLHRQQDSI